MAAGALRVRFWRRCAFLLLALLLLPLLAAGTWRALQVSERRAYDATLEHLRSSLSAQVAEHLASGAGARLAPAGNPFALLRWQGDGYCGELADPRQAAPGCWYYLPGQAAVLYRSRFFDRWQGNGDELHVFALVEVPAKTPNASQSVGSVVGLELQPDSAAGLSATSTEEVLR